ncbi:MAG: HDOD domain-containing protein, partial [Candidatus Cloacimonetes bacterium]|nr:HDOD domain-containing protein [Candidatus Cloacimonadota bacterium]
TVRQNIPLQELETKLLGVNHAEVGARLLKQWNIPEPIWKIVLQHHTPFDNENDVYNSCLVYLSNYICNNQRNNHCIEAPQAEFDERVWSHLSMSVSDIPMIVRDVTKKVEIAHQVLQIGMS